MKQEILFKKCQQEQSMKIDICAPHIESPKLSGVENVDTSVNLTEEAFLILQALHSKCCGSFQEAVDKFLTYQEKRAIEAAEVVGLYPQIIRIYNEVFSRLERRFAEIVSWPNSALAKVVQSARIVPARPKPIKCVILDLQSRNLCGHVAFKVSDPKLVSSKIPLSAIELLCETKNWWFKVGYMEPLYSGGKVIRSYAEAMRHFAPKDPLILAFLGVSPFNFRWNLSNLWGSQSMEIPLGTQVLHKPLVFLLAHWT
jgi:hypothetical protein